MTDFKTHGLTQIVKLVWKAERSEQLVSQSKKDDEENIRGLLLDALGHPDGLDVEVELLDSEPKRSWLDAVDAGNPYKKT